MIKNWQVSVAALAMNEGELRKAWRQAIAFIFGFAVLFLILYIGMLAWTIWNLLAAWHTGRAEDWREFWDNARQASTFLYPLLSFSAVVIWQSGRDSIQRVVAARQAAVAGDDARAPVSAQQPEALKAADLLLSTRVRPLRAPGQAQRTPVLVAALFVLLAGLILGLLGLALLTIIPSGTFDSILQILGWVLVGGGAFGFAGSALLLYRFYRLSRPLVVEADDWGLRWRTPGRRALKSLPWHEAQAFVVLHQRVGTEYARESAFALVGRETTLTWLVKPTEVYGAHEQLTRLIVARTKLPLRDITGDVESAERAQDPDTMTALETKVSTEQKRAELAAHLALSRSPHAPQTIEAPVASPAAAQPARASTGCLVILLALLLPLTPQGVGWGLQQYQQGHYAGLPDQVHAQTPVFEDRLAFDDGRWPVDEGDQYHQSWFYQDGAYHMRGADATQTISAQGPTSYGDVAVEVTAAQVNRGRQSDAYHPYDGVGLLLRASERNADFVAFLVTPSGNWTLWRFHDVGDPERNWNEISYGRSDAIHLGVGEQNRVLVIISGARYLCYVNGQFLGAYEDDGPQLLQGHMGVFVNESVTEGVFSDFAVYPPPALDPLPFT